MRNHSNAFIFGWVIFIISELAAVLAIIYLHKFDFKPVTTTNEGHHKLWNPGLICLAFGTIFSTAHAMVLFRLIQGYNTRIIKYIHAAMHTINLFLASYGLYKINKYRNTNSDFDLQLSGISVGLPVVLMVAYFIQWLGGVFVFLYLYSSQARRRSYAAWHNFIGICMLHLSVAMFASFCYNFDFHNDKSTVGGLAITFLVIYVLLIDLIVLNPYLEWPLCGPL